MGRSGSKNGLANGGRGADGRFRPGGTGGPGRPRRRADHERRASQLAALTGVGRADGWSNALTGIGSSVYDKRVGGTFGSASLTNFDEAEIWEGNALGARIVETWPNEMTREGWRLVIRGGDDARDISEQVEAHHEAIGLVDALWETLAFEGAYGGGATLLGARDFRDLAAPLELGRVSSFDWVTTFDPSEMYPRFWYDDPRAPKFGQPSHYEIIPMTEGIAQNAARALPSKPILVHESRLIVFRGHRVSRRRSMPGKLGWGQSKLGRVHGVLRDHNMGFDAAAILLHDFAQSVFKIKNLADAMAEDRDEEIKVRTQAVEMSRSVARTVIIDAEEEFERKQTPITGLPETLDRFCAMLAAAADMPLTLLMGQSPGGLNATGDSDIRFFYDRVKAAQVKRLRPALEKITALTFRALGIEEPEQWSIQFNPLWQESNQEKAESRKMQAETDKIYMEAMVLSPSDVSRSRFGGDGYSFDTDVDFEERDRLEEEQRDLDRMAQEQSIKSAEAAAKKSAAKPSGE